MTALDAGKKIVKARSKVWSAPFVDFRFEGNLKSTKNLLF